jgi:hypothetical protein
MTRHPTATAVLDAVLLVASLPFVLVLAAGLAWVGRRKGYRWE